MLLYALYGIIAAWCFGC